MMIRPKRDIENWPETYRPPTDEQWEMLDWLEEELPNSEISVLSAPMRSGKTAPVLTKALESGDQILWSCGTHNAFQEPQRVSIGIHQPYSVFTGKRRMCNNPEAPEIEDSRTFKEFCDRERRYHNCPMYENTVNETAKGEENQLTERARVVLDNAKYTVRNKPRTITGTLGRKIESDCDHEDLCPYEVMAGLAKESSLLIGDYYYFIGPIRRPFLSKKIGIDRRDSLLIVDEADMFIKRVRETLARSSVSDSGLSKFETMLEKSLRSLWDDGEISEEEYREKANLFGEIEEAFLSFCKKKLERSKEKEIPVEKEEFSEWIESETGKTMMEWSGELEDLSDNYIFASGEYKKIPRLNGFFERWNYKGDFARILRRTTRKRRKNYELQVIPLDLARAPLDVQGGDPVYLDDILSEYERVVFMSATLGKPDAFLADLGTERKSERVSCLEVESYFVDPKDALVILHRGVTSRSSKRSDEENIELIRRTLRVTRDVTDDAGLDTNWFVASNSFADCVGEVDELEPKSLFSDETRGIDLRKGSLVITGVPIPPPSKERELRKESWKERLGKVEAERVMAREPMNKVIQSMGRIFNREREENRGLIVLGDERYELPKYYSHVPGYFRDSMLVVSDARTLSDAVERFWLRDEPSSKIISDLGSGKTDATDSNDELSLSDFA